MGAVRERGGAHPFFCFGSKRSNFYLREGRQQEERESSIKEKISKLALSIIFLFGGLAMVVISLNILPVIGLVFAVPMLAFSVYFYKAHLNERCQIEKGKKDA
jgi:NhaP-type Na+/H+ or K+/H+ antiporter